ncbi:MAG: transposase [Candidatus Cloacimonetes bacterium]|nr:transposase [Candidatus Cloacimonadota bacterium]
MEELNLQYWSHGPHFQFNDSIVFITWRLAFTLPHHILDLFHQLRKEACHEEKDREINYLQQNNARLFKIYQEYDLELASFKHPGFSLNETEIAKIITDAFHYFDGVRFELLAFCVMSNHIHLLVQALKQDNGEYYRISNIVQSLKRYTAKEINSTLGKKGQVWDDYYFDRIIRTSKSYDNVVNYILMNPVAAGLVDSPEKWRDSYYSSH